MNVLDEELIRLLAWQRIQQLLSPKSLQPSNKCGIPPAVTASVPKPSPQADGNKTHQSHHTEAVLLAPPVITNQVSFAAQKRDVQARAVLCPLTGKGAAINMCYRTLYIGTGTVCHKQHCLRSFECDSLRFYLCFCFRC